jgi:hypothetical protein
MFVSLLAAPPQISDTALRILLVALLASWCAGCGSVSPDPAAPSATEEPITPAPARLMRELTAAEKSILAEGFTAGLYDPESVKFRWTKVPKDLVGAAFEYCGLINLKNDTGGFTGMKPFLATIRTENGNIIGGAIAAVNSEDIEGNRDVIPKLCRQKGLDPFDAK